MHLTSPLEGIRKLGTVRGMILGLTAAAGLNVGQWLYLLTHVRRTSDPIPLHYTITFGIDRIGPWYAAYLLPVSGTIIVVANLLLASVLVANQRTTAAFTVIITVFMQLAFLAGAILNFRAL